MEVNEVFESIQGEGKYSGAPVLFIRLSGCTRKCKFCDTQYHKDGETNTIEDVVKTINKSKKNIIVWTGGEPMLQSDELLEVIRRTKNKIHHVETNGDILFSEGVFDYVCFSPKDEEALDKAIQYEGKCDIKVVTDIGHVNRELIHGATMLMPLTVLDKEKSKHIEQMVWDYCVKHNINFCLRQHVCVWGVEKKGV